MVYKCSVCQLIRPSVPERCPKCQNPGEKYVELTGEQRAKIERSRLTNGLLVKLLTLLEELDGAARTGIEDNLDPWCLAIFNRAHTVTEELSASVRAEIEGHVLKSKWG